MKDFSISILEDDQLSEVLPKLFDILYGNMSVIAPTGDSYQEDRDSWIPCMLEALQKPQRKMLTIHAGDELAGFFLYYVNNGLFMMEEIQLKPEYHGSGVFHQLYRYLFTVIPEDTEWVEAYANRENRKSQGILGHLGLNCIGENKNGHMYHYRGSYQTLRERFGEEK